MGRHRPIHWGLERNKKVEEELIGSLLEPRHLSFLPWDIGIRAPGAWPWMLWLTGLTILWPQIELYHQHSLSSSSQTACHDTAQSPRSCEPILMINFSSPITIYPIGSVSLENPIHSHFFSFFFFFNNEGQKWVQRSNSLLSHPAEDWGWQQLTGYSTCNQMSLLISWEPNFFTRPGSRLVPCYDLH